MDNNEALQKLIDDAKKSIKNTDKIIRQLDDILAK